jgi:hypothetical protein
VLEREARRSIHEAVRDNLADHYAAVGRPTEAARYR